MNETIKNLKERKSVRQFSDKPLEEHIKKQIISSAFYAPSAGNQKLFTIIDVTDTELKEKLSISCDNQPFIKSAPLVLIFFADCKRWLDTYNYAGLTPRKPGAGDLFLACADAIIAAQNTVVAASSLGVGSCYIGDILENIENVKSLLKLPPYLFPAAMVVYGYPTEGQTKRIKPKPIEEQFAVFENEYKELTKEEHIEMFTLRGDVHENKSFEDFVTAFHNRKYASDFSLEMTRSANEYLKEYE